MTNGDSGSRFNYKTNGNRGVLLIGPRGSTWHTQGPQEGVKQRVERERESGQMLFSGFVGEVLQGSLAKVGLVNSNQKRRGP